MNLFIDGNAIGNAAHNGGRLNYGGMQVQAIFGFIKSMRVMLEEHTAARAPVVLWDGRARWRFELFPDYKKSRQEGNEKPADAERRQAYKEQRPFIQEAMKLLGVTQMQHANLEADDLAGFLCGQTNKQTLLVTGDQDWLQLVSRHISWHDPIRDRTVTYANFAEFTGCLDAQSFVQSKALQGDSSDEITGVGGLGEKRASEFLLEHNSVEYFWAKCDSGEYTPRLKRELNLQSPEGRAIFNRNMKLMDLRNAPRPDKDGLIITKGQFDRDGFADFCHRMGFLSITRDLDRFVSVFQERASV